MTEDPVLKDPQVRSKCSCVLIPFSARYAAPSCFAFVFETAFGPAAVAILTEGWTDTETPLKAQFEIQVPGYASKAGQRLLVPVGIFHLTGQQPFSSTRRTNAVYLDYPWESYEQAKVALPSGFEIESVPPTTRVDRGSSFYESSSTKQGNTAQFNRTLKMAGYYVPVERYPVLKQFYELIRAGDEQQAVFKALPASDKH